VRDGEGRHDREQGTQSPKWDDQAEHKKQVIDPVENVMESERDEAERCLVPARIEIDDTRIADILERALRR
jgi:hypothetical protein